MSKSAAFARIRREVLELTLQVPLGRVSTFAAFGAALDIMPRHVAYILATLPPEEEQLVPWHRLVGARGELLIGPKMAKAKQIDAAATEKALRSRRRAEWQRKLLRAEGVPVGPEGSVTNLEKYLWSPPCRA